MIATQEMQQDWQTETATATVEIPASRDETISSLLYLVSDLLS